MTSEPGRARVVADVLEGTHAVGAERLEERALRLDGDHVRAGGVDQAAAEARVRGRGGLAPRVRVAAELDRQQVELRVEPEDELAAPLARRQRRACRRRSASPPLPPRASRNSLASGPAGGRAEARGARRPLSRDARRGAVSLEVEEAAECSSPTRPASSPTTCSCPGSSPARSAEMRVADEVTVKVADTVPSLTEVAPVKPEPLIVTLVPVHPKFGEKLVIFGRSLAAAGDGERARARPRPAAVRDRDLPGRRAARDGGGDLHRRVDRVRVADVPLNLTAVTPVKFVPLTVTLVPTGPLVGVNDVTVGGEPPPPVTVKLAALVPVPFGVVTEILPVVAPPGTCAVMSDDELTTKLGSRGPVELHAGRAGEVRALHIDGGAHSPARRRERRHGRRVPPPPDPYVSRHVEPSFDHSCCR